MAKKKAKAKRPGKTRRSPAKKKTKKKRSAGRARVTPSIAPPAVIESIPLEAQIERKKLEIQELQARKLNYTEIPCDVTVVIPCYNAFAWLGKTLLALAYGNQSIPIKVLLCDNGSTDPLGSCLRSEPGMSEMNAYLGELGFVGGGILSPVLQKDTNAITNTPLEPQERINKNLEHLWKKMTMAVKTKYIWYVDGDVIPPKDSGFILRTELEKDKELGFVGVMYDPKTDHVKMGCSMGRTSVMQKLEFQSMGCPCRWVNYALRSLGHTVKHVEPHVRGADSHERMVAPHGRALSGRVVRDVIEGRAG